MNRLDIAVLSDVHGNYEALKTCIKYISDKGIKTLVFLGDYTGELAYPKRTMQYIYELKEQYECYFIKGNKEDYWLNYEASGETGWKDWDSTTGSLLYTYNRLTKKDMDFYKSLSHVLKLEFVGFPAITFCHGSPNKANEKLLPDNDKTFNIMKNSDTDIIICGHTHVQGKLIHSGRFLYNAGAVGVPLYSDGKSQFLILHGENGEWTPEFISLNYDSDKVIRELYEDKLDEHAPAWCRISAELLKNGRVPHGRVLARAMKLCEEDTGSCIWPDVPEYYWQQAINEML